MKLFILGGILAVSAAIALQLGPAPTQGFDAVLLHLRLPRMLAALVTGAGLSVAGIGMQALLRNPLADPYVLGLSSGASLGAVLTFVGLTAIPVELGASAGALVATGLVFFIARDSQGLAPSTRLILSGVAVAAVLASTSSFLLLVAPREASVRGALYFGSGSFAGAPLGRVAWVGGLVLLALGCAWRWSPDLDRLLLGEETAATLGVDTPRLRRVLLFGCSGLTGILVALAGPMGFVGLVAPHLGRLLVGPGHRRLVPIAALLGALLLLWADTIGRTCFVPREVPAGLLSAVCGGPFFLYLLAKRSYGFGGAA